MKSPPTLVRRAVGTAELAVTRHRGAWPTIGGTVMRYTLLFGLTSARVPSGESSTSSGGWWWRRRGSGRQRLRRRRRGSDAHDDFAVGAIEAHRHEPFAAGPYVDARRCPDRRAERCVPAAMRRRRSRQRAWLRRRLQGSSDVFELRAVADAAEVLELRMRLLARATHRHDARAVRRVRDLVVERRQPSSGARAGRCRRRARDRCCRRRCRSTSRRRCSDRRATRPARARPCRLALGGAGCAPSSAAAPTPPRAGVSRRRRARRAR